MIALVAPPAVEPAINIELLRDTRAAEPAKVARLIANLHTVLVNPDAAPGAAAAAKRMLLAALSRTKDLRLPSMIVPPVANRPEAPARAPRVELPDADPVCGTCRRPVAQDCERSYDPFPKTARASSSPRFRANHSTTNRAHARASHPIAGLATSRGTELREYAECS